MIASKEYLLRAIAQALESDVLPALDPKSWPAGSLRGTLLLLTYLEDRIRLEGDILAANNAALRGLLAEAIGADRALLASEQAAAIAEALAAYPAREAFVDIKELERENEHYLDLARGLIAVCWEEGKNADPARRALRARLDACLVAIDQRDAAITARAEGMLPI